ncbi:uncharacterized protein LAJ45_02494 [Morchella importuna]|uniref:uncharacterized protein n=1 Tax=Morchella importuna TaxID=1174673 RepID=UPI001E8DBB4B|nr:uncharacterized protein LAJ45_02494 [Morchella importuna]KAH8153681.1 hypothetical protein LAJ45_02494 [Morchella importuna]
MDVRSEGHPEEHTISPNGTSVEHQKQTPPLYSPHGVGDTIFTFQITSSAPNPTNAQLLLSKTSRKKKPITEKHGIPDLVLFHLIISSLQKLSDIGIFISRTTYLPTPTLLSLYNCLTGYSRITSSTTHLDALTSLRQRHRQADRQAYRT